MPQLRLTRLETSHYRLAGHACGGWHRHMAADLLKQARAADELDDRLDSIGEHFVADLYPALTAWLKAHAGRMGRREVAMSQLDAHGRAEPHRILREIGVFNGLDVPATEGDVRTWVEDGCVVAEWDDPLP